MKKQKQRKPLDEKGDSYESSYHQRPACLRASSQQSNADTMNPTGPPFSPRKNLGPRGPKNLVTTRAQRKCFSQELLFLAGIKYFSQIARISQIGAACF